MTKHQNRWNILIAVVLFLGGLYLAEASSFSSSAIAKINGGYGTFDMKNYDVNIYLQVMEATEDFSLYWKYYVCDFIFIVVFLNLMIQAVSGLNVKNDRTMKRISYILAGTRGLLDAVENILLMYLIYGYPNANTVLVTISNVITRIKFLVMGGWILCFLVYVVLHFLQKRR